MKKEEILNLLRETAMRCQIAMPEEEQDVKWFEEGLTVGCSGDFMERLFAALSIGKIDDAIPDEECKGAKCTIPNCQICKNEMY